MMSQLNWQLSERVAELVSAELGSCVANVARAFRCFRSELPAKAAIVQGIWMIGGQPGLHVWIEAGEMIIDPTLVCESNTALRQTATHHPIDRFTEAEFAARHKYEVIAPGARLEMDLSWDDPRVEELLDRIDPP